MSRVPGRATSLASVGMLLGLAGLAIIVSAAGAAPGVSAAGTTLTNAANVHSRSGAHGAGSTAPTSNGGATSDGGKVRAQRAVTQSFRCPAPAPAGSAAPSATPQLTSKEPGSPSVTASTHCKGSSWYVAENLGALVAEPFRIPDDPPIPASVPVAGFVPVLPGSIPAALVRRDNFGSAALYELFTSSDSKVAPVRIAPGGSPVLLLRSASLLQGAGFTCTPTTTGEVIRQYEWYVINPTKLKTSSEGVVLGDPGVFLEITIYTAQTAQTFTSTALAIVQRGYNDVEPFTHDSC